MKSKHGNISLLVSIVVVILVAVVIWMAVGGDTIKAAYTSSIINPLLEKAGLLDEDSEQEEIEQELLEAAEGSEWVFLCDDEHCSDDNPPTEPWRRTTDDINSICDVTPVNEDSEPDGNRICGEIGSIRIIGPYDVRLYERENYAGKKICFSNKGGYRLDDFDKVPHNGWNKDTDSVEILADGACTNPGVTEE